MSGILEELLIGATVGGAVALWPGHSLTVTIREAARRRGGASFLIAAGRAAADLLALALLGILASCYGGVLVGGGAGAIAFGVLSAAALALFGWKLMEYRAPGALERERGDRMVRMWHRHLFLDRFLGSFGSPLWHLFWWTAGALLVFLAVESSGAPGAVAFGGGFLGAGVAWRTFVAVRLRSPGRERVLRDRQFRILTSLFGLALVAIGLELGVNTLAHSPVRSAMEKIVSVVF